MRLVPKKKKKLVGRRSSYIKQKLRQALFFFTKSEFKNYLLKRKYAEVGESGQTVNLLLHC
jgi:hypothetical protein